MSRRKEEDQERDGTYSLFYCENCHRGAGEGVDLRRDHIRHAGLSLWFLKKEDLGSDKKCLLCEVCRGNDHPWTGWIWYLLRDESTFQVMWKFLPNQWKLQWKEEVINRHGSGVDLDATTYVVDMTNDRKNYNKHMDLNNLKNTGWSDFVRCFEKYIALPVVRCPWGCCESLNRVNLIPYDTVVSHFITKSIPSYTKKSPGKEKYYGFRNDLMDSKSTILLKWPCNVSVVVEDRKPFVLCCRFHSSSHTVKYLHAPRNPTGSISFQGDNTLAEIVAVPRTIGTFRKNKYNNSYGMMKLMGNFSGIDCIDVSTQNEYLNKKGNILTNRRDGLVRIGRESIWKDSTDHVVSNEDRLLVEKYAKGSTYMALEDVINLQKQMRQTPINTIIVVNREDNTKPEKKVSYVPCWNDLPLKICTYNDPLGKPFQIDKAYTECIPDQFTTPFFFLSNIILMIPEIWRLVSQHVKRNDTWHGWFLQYLSRKVLHISERGRVGLKHPFYTKRDALQELMDIFTSLTLQPTIADFVEGSIGSFDSISVITDGHLPATIEHEAHTTAVVTVYNKDITPQTLFPSTVIPSYDLRMVGYIENTSGYQSILIKHKETLLFWKYTKKKNGVVHVGLSETEFRDTLQSIKSEWQFCVYIKIENIDIETIKTHLLESIGGQSKIKCRIHEKPVVVIPMRMRKLEFNKCKCSNNNCDNIQTMQCPTDGCDKGVCGICYRKIMERRDVTNWWIGETIDKFMEDGSDHSSDDCSWTLCSVVEEEDDTIIDDDTLDEIESVSDNSEDSRYSFCNGCDDVSASYSGTSDGSSIMSLIVEADEEEDDLVWDVADESSSDDLEDEEGDAPMVKDPDLFPATNVAKKGFIFDPTSMVKEGLEIPNHIILNGMGSCLVRRNRTLKPTTAGRHFIEKLVLTKERGHIPIVYYEGSMFPTIFYKSINDGAILGSLPVCLLADDKTLTKLGVATMLDHTRTRLMNPDLLTSTCQPFWGYSYDMSANLGTRGYNTQVVLRRGFDSESKNGKNQFRISTDDPRLYDGEQIDSRKTVNQLAAACARKKSDFFYTWTMNASSTPGVRIITEWLRSKKGYDTLEKNMIECSYGESEISNRYLPEKEREELQCEFEEAGCIYVARAWMEFVELFLYYLQHGKDSPFKGPSLEIGNIWNRSEIQNDKDGKAPHQHTLIFLKNPPKDEKELNEILVLIRASMEYFISENEKEKIKENGILSSSFETMINFLDKAEELLKHHCTSRCLIPVQKKNKKTGEKTGIIERRCKQPDYRLLSPHPNVGCFQSIQVEHDENAKKVLANIGVIEKKYRKDSEEQLLDFIPSNEYVETLSAKRYCPPCGTSGTKQSLANPFLFGMTASAMNLQYTHGYLVSRYLAKYVASVDKSNRIELSMKKESGPIDVELKPEIGFNSKITGNKIAARESLSKTDTKKILGRTLPMSELVMQCMNYRTVMTDFKYEYIPTQALAFRTSVARKRPIIEEIMKDFVGDAPSLRDLNVSYINASYEVRRLLEFEKGRQLTKYQLYTYADCLYDDAKLDKIGQFSLRPPELLFVSTPCMYLSWFTRTKIKQWKDSLPADQKVMLMKMLQLDFEKSPWIDCCGYMVKIRPLAIPKIYKILKDYPNIRIDKDFGSSKVYQATLSIFKLLNGESMRLRSEQSIRINSLKQIFVDETDRSNLLPIYWYRTVRATDAERFLYHVLLSMGKFNTEFELYTKGSMKKAFVYAQLLDDSSERALTESVKQLTKRYLTEQLFHYPLGTHSLDREIVETERIFTEYFQFGTMSSINMPSALFTLLKEECTSEIENSFCNSRGHLVKSFTTRLKSEFPSDMFPSDESIVGATRTKTVPFDITHIPKTDGQSEISYQEHQVGYTKIKSHIDHYAAGTNTLTKSIALVGAGGVGKTVDLRIAGLYALSQGLSVFSTTLTGKRGAETAGEHIHVRFKIPFNDETLSINEMVEKAYTALLKDPKRMVYLQRVDIILLDELGQISSKLLAVIDRLMRRIRHSNLFMGGVLVIATMDGKQMKPISGFSPVLSPAMMCCFIFISLTIPLRTLDVNLQRIQAITRNTPNELRAGGEALEKEFKSNILQHCTFCLTYEELRGVYKQNELIYCYPRHEDCISKEHAILQELKEVLKTTHSNHTIRKAEDFERIYMQTTPSKASLSTSKSLDKHGPSRELIFHEGAAFEITFNDSNGHFFRGQLCIMLDVPDKESTQSFKPVKVLRAPPGTDNLPALPYVKSDLLERGWEEVLIGKEKPDKYYKIGKKGLAGYRRQYGLKHWISITIHGIMGATVDKLVTRLDSVENKGLWEAAMVVVLMSRTRFAKDLIFIGDRQRTVDILWNTLLAGGKYNEITQHVLNCLISDTGQPDHILDLSLIRRTFTQIPTMLPTKGNHVVYLLVSIKDPHTTYVGHSSDIRKRLNIHNSYNGGSYGTGIDHRNLAPYGLLAMVVGFEDKRHAESFEQIWKNQIECRRQATQGRVSSMTLMFLPNSLLTQKDRENGLRLAQCGNVEEENV